MKAINLRCEYLVNPIGIDIRSPRLFWNCSEGIKQTAFKIKAFKNGVLDFETEKIVSSNMYFDYLNQLSSRDVITWQVALFDENDVEGEYSPLASFEMGLLNPIDWQTKWIRGDYKVNKKQRYPIDCFKKEIPLKNISSARLYVTALG